MDSSLLRYHTEQKFVFIDTETCNLNLVDTDNVPWQWAWLCLQNNKTLFKANHYVKWPTIKIGKEAAFITGFYEKDVLAKGKDPEFVLDELEKIIYNPEYKLVIHNGLNFDVYIHNIHRKLLGRKPDYSYIDRVIDTSAIYKAHKVGAVYNPSESFLAYQYRFVNLKERGLKSSAKYLSQEYDIPYDDKAAHGADYDVELLSKIWKKMIKDIKL